MNLMKSILFVAIPVCLAYACKDKDEDPPTDDNNQNNGKTRTELLMTGSWKISALVSSGTDIWNTPFVESCNKDNEYVFRSNDTLVLYDKASKCDVSDPDSTFSSYKLYDNDTKLILNVRLTSTTTLDDTTDIVELNQNTLKINAEYSGLPATVTFIHP